MKRVFMACAIVFAILLLTACSSELEFTIDNPTSSAIQVTLDEQLYNLPPNSEQKVRLNAGPHTIEAVAIGKQQFMVYAMMDGGLINPTLSDYVVVTERYYTEEALNSGRDLRSVYKKEITLDGVPFQGEFDHYYDLFIDKKWSLGTRDEMPDDVYDYSGSTRDNTVRSKLFTATDFVTYAEGENYQGYFEENRQNLPPRVYKPKDILALTPSFTDKKLAAKYEPLLSLGKQYLLADTAKEQKNISKALNEMNGELIHSIDFGNENENKAWSEVTDFISSLYVSALPIPNS